MKSSQVDLTEMPASWLSTISSPSWRVMFSFSSQPKNDCNAMIYLANVPTRLRCTH